MIKVLVMILGGLIALIVFSNPSDYEYTTAKVVEVLDCTEAASNFFDGHNPGQCRLVLDNGERLTIRRPVAIGDEIKYCSDSRCSSLHPRIQR